MKKNLFLLSTVFVSALANAEVVGWTAWLDRDSPTGNGEYETRGDFPASSVCSNPSGIEAKYLDANGQPVVITPSSTAPNYLRGFSPVIGLVCLDSDQASRGFPACNNYAVRFNCTPGGREDLSIKYPALKAVDVENAEYVKTAPAFIGRNLTSVARTIQPATSIQLPSNAKTTGEEIEITEGVFNLGAGFDSINATYRNQCLNQNDPAFKVVSNPSTAGSTFEVLHTESQAQLYSALDESLSVGASGTFPVDGVDVTAGIELNSSVVKVDELTESHEVYVAKYTSSKKRYTLQTQPRPIKSTVVDTLLRVNQESYKRDFFSECGDRYVDGAELGGNLYVVFVYDKKIVKSSEQSSVSGKVNAGIKDVFDVNVSGQRKSDIKSLFSKYKVRIYSATFGGPDIAHLFTLSDVANFGTHLKTFAEGINDTNWRAVDTFYREYTLPAIYASENYNSVFKDTNTFINYAQKYAALINEYDMRCMQTREYNTINSANLPLKYCSNNTLKSDIAEGRRNCGISNQWDKCIHPRDHIITGNALLIDELTKNTPAFSFGSWTSGTADNYVKTKPEWKTTIKKCISDSRTACMTAGCFENRSETSNGLGFNYVEGSYSSPAQSGEQGVKNIGNVYTDSNNRRCVNAYVKACTRDALGSSAFYNFRIEITGACPIIKQFPSD